MRKYVKSWVTQLDLLRLYPGKECEIEVSSWKPSYEEPQNTQEMAGDAMSPSTQSEDASPEDVSEVMPSEESEEAELVASVCWPDTDSSSDSIS
jgi:hypothetical protein